MIIDPTASSEHAEAAWGKKVESASVDRHFGYMGTRNDRLPVGSPTMSTAHIESATEPQRTNPSLGGETPHPESCGATNGHRGAADEGDRPASSRDKPYGVDAGVNVGVNGRMDGAGEAQGSSGHGEEQKASGEASEAKTPVDAKPTIDPPRTNQVEGSPDLPERGHTPVPSSVKASEESASPTSSAEAREEGAGGASAPGEASSERASSGADSGSGESGAEAAPPPPAKIIKRYSNRKLYDTARSRYVTLEEIARMVKAGEDVCIIDNESKEDLTSVTLTQIIYEQEKSSRRMPLGMLRGIIQTSGETLNEFFDRSVATAQKSVETSVTELRQSALSIREAAARQLAELTESARRFFSREERRAEEFRRAAWLAIDQLELRVTERIREVQATRAALEQHETLSENVEEGPGVDELLERNTHTLEHVSALRTRLAAMSVHVDRLEKAARGTAPVDEDE